MGEVSESIQVIGVLTKSFFSQRSRGEEAKMLRISLLFGLVAFAACENWPDLKTTWGLNPFGAAFASQPRTESDAASAGWQAIAHCDGKFLGHRYADPSDPSLVMIYDDAGYIAGVQSVLLESDVDMSYNDLTKQPVYLQFDYTPDQACDSVLPFQILYDRGVITGFVWQHIASLPGDKWEHPDAMAVAAIVDRPPTCMTDALDYPGVSTMHHYFYNYPWLTGCPFNQARAGLRKMMHMGKKA